MSDDLASHLPAQSALAHFESYAKIEDERTKALTTPKANVFQRRMYEAYETLLAIMLAVDWAFEIRILGLKIRQCGGTTCANHIIYHHSQRFATDSVVMTNVNTNSKEVLRRMKIMAQNDAFPWNNPIDPLATNLSWPNGSRSDITSAETTNVGISRTRQAALFSECAKYPRGGVKDDKAIMASILPSLNQLGIAESTPEGACYDTETDVLTDRGWKRFSELTGDEAIMTKSQATGIAYYQPNWNKVAYHHHGKMVRIDTRTANLLVTPNHMLWCAAGRGKMRFAAASQVAQSKGDIKLERSLDWRTDGITSITVPAYTHKQGNGSRTLPPIDIPLNIWLPFFGHWLSDGHVTFIPCNRCVILTQVKFIGSFRESATRLAAHMGLKLRDVPHGNGRRFIIESAQLASYMTQFSKPKRIGRELLMGLSRDQCRVLIDAIYEGDGDQEHRNRDTAMDYGKIYAGIDSAFVDDFQELALKAGYATSAYGPDRNRVATFTESIVAKVIGGKAKYEQGYDGMVYCVSLPRDHLLMVRRGGTAVWCGNSGWMYEQWHGTKDMPGAMTLQDFLAEMKRGNKKPGNGWVKVFAAWFEFEENRRHVSDSERETIMRTLTNREVNGINTYKWTAEQIAWRRDKLYSECGGSEDLFSEYYPEDEMSCFLSSGRPRFNMGAIVRMERRLHLYSIEAGTLNPNPGGMVFIPDTSGYAPIQIWERPRAGCKYLVWCDPATGEDQTESANPDRHSIGVLRAGYSDGVTWHKPKVVARVRPPFTGEGDVVIEHIARLSEFYGLCIVVLEVNMGLHILKGLKDMNVPLFKREVTDPKDREKTLLLYGWKLKDRDQRREVVVCLASHIRDEAIEIPCPHIISEAKTFVIDKNGKETARSGCHDDDILGLGMALTCVGAATTYHGPHRVKRAPADRHKWRRHPSYNYPRD